MQSRPVVERNGAILVWNHHLGKDPFYEVPELDGGSWTPPRWEQLTLEMHIMDIAENGVANVQQDQDIFENKRFVARPILCEDDGPLPELRLWLRQFFPDLAAQTGSAEA